MQYSLNSVSNHEIEVQLKNSTIQMCIQYKYSNSISHGIKISVGTEITSDFHTQLLNVFVLALENSSLYLSELILVFNIQSIVCKLQQLHCALQGTAALCQLMLWNKQGGKRHFRRVSCYNTECNLP